MNWSRAANLLACAAALGAALPGFAADRPRLAATLLAAEDSAALIEFPGGQSWLQPGQVAAGCRLLRVEETAAELECRNEPLRLELEGDPREPVAAPPPETAMTGIELPPGTLQSLAARPQAVALAADFAPLVEDGQLRGWTVARLDPEGALAGFGLREADVIRAVNGAPAAEPAAFAAAIRALPATYAFTVDLSRDSRPLTLTIAAPPAPHSGWR